MLDDRLGYLLSYLAWSAPRLPSARPANPSRPASAASGEQKVFGAETAPARSTTPTSNSPASSLPSMSGPSPGVDVPSPALLHRSVRYLGERNADLAAPPKRCSTRPPRPDRANAARVVLGLFGDLADELVEVAASRAPLRLCGNLRAAVGWFVG